MLDEKKKILRVHTILDSFLSQLSLILFKLSKKFISMADILLGFLDFFCKELFIFYTEIGDLKADLVSKKAEI